MLLHCIYPSWLQMYKIFYYALIECAREKRRKMKYERWAQHFFVFCFCMLRLSVFKCLYTLSLPHSLTPRCCLVQFLSMQIEIWERSKDRNRDCAVENEWEEACRSWAKFMNYLMKFYEKGFDKILFKEVQFLSFKLNFYLIKDKKIEIINKLFWRLKGSNPWIYENILLFALLFAFFLL